MAVALEKMPVVSGGSADVSRPNDSGLHGLADALSVGVRSAADIAVTAQANEINHVTSLMNDAVAGPDELKEIHDNAFFPLAKYAVKNRMGEALVAQNRQGIEDALAAAPDPIAARETLRAKQQELAQQAGDPAILVGIHQAIADLAGPALNKAAARRQEMLNQQRRQAEATLFQGTSDDPAAFAKAIGGAVFDQNLADPTKVSEVHQSASQTLLNRMIENPDFTQRAKDAARAALALPNLTPEDRRQYNSVLHTARALEEKEKDGLTYAQNRAAAFNAIESQIIAYVESGRPVPTELIDQAGSLAPNRLAFHTSLIDFVEKTRQRTTGLLMSPVAGDARQQLKEQLNATKKPSITGARTERAYSPQFVTDALQSFDALMERVPRDLDTDSTRKAVQAAQEAAVTHATHLEERRKTVNQEWAENETKIQQASELLNVDNPAHEKDPVKREALANALRTMAKRRKEMQTGYVTWETNLHAHLLDDLKASGVTILDIKH